MNMEKRPHPVSPFVAALTVFLTVSMVNFCLAAPNKSDVLSQIYLKKKKGFLDFVGRNKKLRRNGSPDAQFRLHVSAPGKTIVGLKIINISGQASNWNTLTSEAGWLLGVVKNRKVLNKKNGALEITLGGKEEVFDLFAQDNNSIVVGKTNYEATLIFKDGPPAVMAVALTKPAKIGFASVVPEKVIARVDKPVPVTKSKPVAVKPKIQDKQLRPEPRPVISAKKVAAPEDLRTIEGNSGVDWDGFREGERKRYRRDGTLDSNWTYSKGKREGVSKDFYANGQVKEETHYKKGNKEGPYKGHFEDGTLKNEGNFKEGKKHGIVKWYFKNGQLGFEGRFENGRQVGVHTKYYEKRDGTQGKVESSISFKNGIKEGEEKKYSKEGIIKYEASYVAGKREGLVKEYRSNGNLEEEAFYVAGKKEGIVKEYRSDGSLEKETSFKKGDEYGPFKKYYPDGTVAEEGNLVASRKPEGTYKKYFKDGKIKSEETYKNGNIEGFVKYIHNDGSVFSEGYYKEGITHKTREEMSASTERVLIENSGHHRDNWHYSSESDKSGKLHALEGEEKPYNGKALTFYQNGRIKGEYIFKNGRKNGVYKEYYDDGTLKMEGTIINDYREGETILYKQGSGETRKVRYKRGNQTQTKP